MELTRSIDHAAMSVIEDHCFSTVSEEVGGLLVGNDREGTLTITAAYPATSASAGQAHVTFTHDVWAELLPVIERDHPDERIVGWYHSHPGFGLFLSEYDQFIQRSFFSDPVQVALVVDPVAGERAWFGWEGDEIALVRREEAGRAAVRQASSGQGSDTSAGRRSVAALLVPALALAVLGFAGGYVLASRSTDDAAAVSLGQDAPDADLQRELDELQTTVQQRDAQIERLKAEAAAAATARGSGTVLVRYRVRPGDTFWGLAEAFYGDGQEFRRLMADNRRLSREGLHAGDVVVVPIRRGDV